MRTNRHAAAAVAVAVVAVTVPLSVTPAWADPEATGRVVRIAGGGADDGQPATAVSMRSRWAAWLPDGSLAIADSQDNRIRGVSSDGTMSTLAGDGATYDGQPTFAGDGGAAPAAALSDPSQVLATPSGDLIILDQGNHRIRRVDHTTGDITTIAGDGQTGTTAASADATTQPMSPVGIAYDPANDVVYFGDDAQGSVWSVGADGTLARVAGGGSSPVSDGADPTQVRLWGPDDLAVMPDGSLIIGSSRVGAIWHVADGAITTVAGAQPGALSDGATAATTTVSTQTLAVAPDGTIYAGGASSTVVDFTIGGVLHVLPGAPCADVTDVDPSGRPLLTCISSVYSQQADGSWQLEAGASGSSAAIDGESVSDLGVYPAADVQANGVTYFSSGNEIDEFGADGVLHHVAGAAGSTASLGDGGPAQEATFTGVRGLAAAPDGGLFVLDNQTLRLITRDGVIHPYAGEDATPVYTSPAPPPDGEDASKFEITNASVEWTAAPNGDIYISDGNAIRIMSWQTHLISTLVPDVAKLGRLSSVYTPEQTQAVALTPDGSLDVLTTVSQQAQNGFAPASGRIIQVNPSTGSWREVYDGQPLSSIVVGTDGTCYGQVTATGQVAVIGYDGSLTQLLGSGHLQGDAQSVTDFYAAPYSISLQGAAADGGLLMSGFSGLFELQPGWAASAVSPVTGISVSDAAGADGKPSLTVSWSNPTNAPPGGHLAIGLATGVVATAAPNGSAVSRPLGTTSITFSDRSPGLRDVVSVYVVSSTGDVSAAATAVEVEPADVTAPGITYVSEGYSADSSATVEWSAPSGGNLDRVEVRIAPGTAAPTGDPVYTDYFGNQAFTFTGLTVGQTYAMTLTAYNFSGHSSVGGPYVFVAGSAPEATITSGPSPGGYSTSKVTIGYSPDGLGGNRDCRLDGTTVDCQAGVATLPTLTNGQHTFSIQLSSPLGAGPLVSRTWTADGTAPTATLTALPPVTLAATTTLHYSGKDVGSAVASYNVRTEHAAYNSVFSAWTTATGQTSTSRSLSLTPGYTYCAEAQAVDKAGNASPWTAPTCTARPLDDRSLTASTGWSSLSGSSFYLGTVRSTTALGVKLSRTGAQFDRLAIVATRCSTCGTIKVLSGSTVIATINLYASSTQRQWVDVLPKVSLRSATVTIVTAAKGKLVQIDGLAITRV